MTYKPYSFKGAQEALLNAITPEAAAYVRWLRTLSIPEHEAEVRRLDERKYSNKKPWED